MIARPPAIGKGALVGVRLQPNPCPNRYAWAAAQDDEPGRSEAIRPLVELGLKVNSRSERFNRRQTDTGVLMVLKTSKLKLTAEYAARRLRLQETWTGLPRPSLSGVFDGN